MPENIAQTYLDIAGVIFVALDSKGRILLINKKGCTILGYKEKDLIGQSWFELCVPKTERTETQKIFSEMINGKLDTHEYHENSIVTKSGDRKIIAWHNSLIKNKDGEAAGTLSSGEDITERRAAEKALRESEARMRAIVETAVDGIITIDEHGIIQTVNPAAEKMFGFQENELTGKNISILMPTPYHEEHNDYIANYVKTGEKKIIGIGREVVGLRKDGSTFPMHLSVSEINLPDQRLFTGIIQDISVKKKLEQQVLQAERFATIGQMAAKVAHEIRSPLSSISLNSELLEDEISHMPPEQFEEAKNLLSSITAEIDRVSALTEEYLQFARLPEAQLFEGNLNHLLEEVLTLVRPELEHKGVSIDFNAPKNTIRTHFDGAQLRRAFLNIIRNATEAMPAGGKINIEIKKNQRKIMIRIRDTGDGIKQDHLHKIFDPFYTTKEFGTGLGLSMTQQIIFEHNGNISADSVEGQGATFIIELPL